MKTLVEPDSKQLGQCIFPWMFIRNGSLFFKGEGGWAISKKKVLHSKNWKKKKFLQGELQEKKFGKWFYYHYFDFHIVEKNLAQPIAHQKNYARP